MSKRKKMCPNRAKYAIGECPFPKFGGRGCPKNSDDQCYVPDKNEPRIPTPKPSKAEVMDKATTTELLSLRHRATMYAQIINEIQDKAEVMEVALDMVIEDFIKSVGIQLTMTATKKYLKSSYLKLAQDEIAGLKDKGDTK